jgi:hypothetical protein
MRSVDQAHKEIAGRDGMLSLCTTHLRHLPGNSLFLSGRAAELKAAAL